MDNYTDTSGINNINNINIGKVTGTFGINGEIKVKILTDFPERFFEEKDFILQKENDLPEKIIIDNARYSGKYLIIKLNNFDNIEQSKKIIGALIQIPREKLKPLPDDSYYEFDIIGIHVYDENNNFIGTISEIINTPNNDVYVIKKDKKEIAIPAFKKYILKIDIKNKIMMIKMPEFI